MPPLHACREYVTQHPEESGIWAGTTSAQRNSNGKVAMPHDDITTDEGANQAADDVAALLDALASPDPDRRKAGVDSIVARDLDDLRALALSLAGYAITAHDQLDHERHVLSERIAELQHRLGKDDR